MESFNFNAKQWLGDDAVLLMDWDVRAMHLHLMCMAWQQDTPGTLPDDEYLLRRWLSNPSDSEWTQRIRPQIVRAWRLADGKWIQDGLLRESERLSSNSLKRRAAANARWSKTPSIETSFTANNTPPTLTEQSFEPEEVEHSGFNTLALLKEQAIFFERANQEERANIWTIGVKLIQHEGFVEPKARQFLGKLIQEYGEKRVAEAIAQLSLKAIPAADARSYLIGILKGDAVKQRKSRSKVAL